MSISKNKYNMITLIDMSNEIYAINFGGYIGESTKSEIEYAKAKGKKISYLENIKYKECLLGYKTVQEHINNLYNTPDFKDISYILSKENLSITYPVMSKNLEYIKKLKAMGYKIYLLTNITEDSYNYINNVINIEAVFDGGIYSYQEHVIKPNPTIYNLFIDRFKLNKEETIFFDDKEKNIIAAHNAGIRGIVFNSIDDIKNNLYEEI